MKHSPLGLVGRSPQSSPVRFDDCAANRKADPHAVILGGVKGFKKPVQRGLIQPGASIPHRYHNTLRPVFRRGNHKVPRRMAAAHGLDRVYEKIEKDLL
jgi:hypothetical protein